MTNLARINRMPTPWVGFDPRPALVTTLPPVTQIQSGSHLLLRLFQKDASCLGTVLLNTCESSSTYAKVYPRSKMGRPVVMKKTLGNMQNLHVGTLWSKIQGLRVSNETLESKGSRETKVTWYLSPVVWPQANSPLILHLSAVTWGKLQLSSKDWWEDEMRKYTSRYLTVPGTWQVLHKVHLNLNDSPLTFIFPGCLLFN